MQQWKLDLIKLLLENGIWLDNVYRKDSCTPLFHACDANQSQAIKVLLEYGANFILIGHADYFILHFACENSSLEYLLNIFNKYKKHRMQHNNQQN